MRVRVIEYQTREVEIYRYEWREVPIVDPDTDRVLGKQWCQAPIEPIGVRTYTRSRIVFRGSSARFREWAKGRDLSRYDIQTAPHFGKVRHVGRQRLTDLERHAGSRGGAPLRLEFCPNGCFSERMAYPV